MDSIINYSRWIFLVFIVVRCEENFLIYPPWQFTSNASISFEFRRVHRENVLIFYGEDRKSSDSIRFSIEENRFLFEQTIDFDSFRQWFDELIIIDRHWYRCDVQWNESSIVEIDLFSLNHRSKSVHRSFNVNVFHSNWFSVYVSALPSVILEKKNLTKYSPFDISIRNLHYRSSKFEVQHPLFSSYDRSPVQFDFNDQTCHSMSTKIRK